MEESAGTTDGDNQGYSELQAINESLVIAGVQQQELAERARQAEHRAQ
jgi:hypothetical protein